MKSGVSKTFKIQEMIFGYLEKNVNYKLINLLTMCTKYYTVPLHPDKGFMNSDILSAKCLKRQYEHVWHRDNSALNCSRYRAAVNCYNFVLKECRHRYYSTVIAENNGNPKALWNTFKKILHKSVTIILPDHVSPTDLANSFGHFFMKIRTTLQSSAPVYITRPSINNSALSSLKPISENDILKILKSSPTKSCELDPIPSPLVKECAVIPIIPITNIINLSLREGSFPNCFKFAYVNPLLKKPSLDRSLLKNYRPVPNLSFISKLIEKAVANQLNSYINKEGLSNFNQSANKRFHSAETALLQIQNDIAASMDSGKAVALTLLDFSAAFNTIDLNILFKCLRDWFGVVVTVLMRIKSIKTYLTNGRQKVKLGNSFSDAFILPYGVPQGSVLLLLLFTLYTTPLSQIISRFNVTHHLYMEDTQIYLALNSRNFDSSIAECLDCVKKWMDGVRLKLNPEKPEFTVIGDRQARESLMQKFPTQFLRNSVSPANEVKSLGVTFDSGNTFASHITKVCCAYYFYLKDFRCIRKFLSVETAALLTNSMISSQIDYSTAIPYSMV